MWDMLFNYGLFLLKVLTVLGAVLVVLVVMMKAKLSQRDPISFTYLNEDYAALKLQVLEQFAKTGALHAKNAIKSEKKAGKATVRAAKDNIQAKPKLYVLNFKGDTHAGSVKSFREEITAILLVAQVEDEVVVKLDSPGGSVIDYGLAAAQMVRIRDAGLKLTVCVDRVAASGGYMMACVAHRICAAPFAFIGSIGVVSHMPNFHNFLKNLGVDVIELTAGKLKRPLSPIGEVTPQGKEHVCSQISAIHTQFKSMVAHYRPDLDIEAVATGDYWTAARAQELGMVDALLTSDRYVTEALALKDVYQVTTQVKPDLKTMLLGKVELFLERCGYEYR